MQELWCRKGLNNVLCGLRHTKEAEAEFLKIVTTLNERAYTQDPGVTALLGWCHYRLRHYDEAIRLLQFSIGGEDAVTIQFDIALAILAGSGIDTYPRAIEVAEGKPKLQQRGLFYIALFDLLEAIRGGHISASHLPVANRLWSKLKESGLSPSEFGWMAEEEAQAQ